MRSTLRRIVCAALLWPLAGCLDGGPTPRGRHLRATRDQDSVLLVPGPAGGPSRILLSQIHQVADSNGFTAEQIATVDDPGPGQGTGAAPYRVLLDSTRVTASCSLVGCGVPIDSLGRLFLDQVTFVPLTGFPEPTATEEVNEFFRIDPATGQRESFGEVRVFRMSADGTHFATLQLADTATQPEWTLRDVGGGQTLLADADQLNFVGNDVFFTSRDGHLVHLSPDGQPQAVAADVSFFNPVDTQRGPLLFLFRGLMPGTSIWVASLLDVGSLAETALPSTTAMAPTIVPSPSGRYLVTQGSSDPQAPGQVTMSLYDRDTSEEMVDSVSSATAQTAPPVWRPGRDEAWFVATDGVWRWQPGAAPVLVAEGASPALSYPPLNPVSPQQVALVGPPVFTPDGRFRLVTTTAFTDKSPVFLQSADDASAAPYLLNPQGTGLAGLWPLAGGQLLLEAWITDARRNDIYEVDPVARTARPLATSGNVVATGKDRFLALLHWLAAGGSGDLSLVDYATGTATLIAENVQAVALDASPVPGDVLAAGTRVVYLVRNRIASPYDGLWAVELP